jgi:hypothetical protein
MNKRRSAIANVTPAGVLAEMLRSMAQPASEWGWLISGFRHGRRAAKCVHICVDLQRVFAEATEWRLLWRATVRPTVLRLRNARSRRKHAPQSRRTMKRRPTTAHGVRRGAIGVTTVDLHWSAGGIQPVRQPIPLRAQ